MMKMPGMYSCREVHELVSMDTFDELGFMARLRFKMHVMMCVHCSRYVKQIKALGDYARRVLGAAPDPERCRQLEETVMSHCDGHGH